MCTVSWANAVFTICNIISVPQENKSPHAKHKEMGCVSFARVPSLCSQSLGHTYSLLLNRLLSSCKRLNGVAKAGGSPRGWGLDWRAQLSVWVQGISVKLEHSAVADQNHSPSYHLCGKSSGNFLSKNGSWEKVFLAEEMLVGPLEKPYYLAD